MPEDNPSAIDAGQQAQDNVLDFPFIFNNAPICIFISTPDGRFLSVNPSLSRILGYDTPDELIESITDIAQQVYADPRDREQIKSLLEANREVHNFECRWIRRDGEVLWISLSACTVSDEAGSTVYYQGFATDITNRERLEKALSDKQELLQDISENIPGLISLTDMTGNFKFSGATHDILGYDQKDLLGENVLSFIHPDDFQKISALFSEFAASGRGTRTAEYRFRCADGSYLWLETLGKMIYDTSGNPKEMVFTSKEVTGRRQAWDKARRERERYFAGLIETTRDGFLLIDTKGGITECNKAYCQMSGYTKDELLQLRVADLHADATRAETVDWIKRIRQNQSALIEARNRRKDGSFFDVEVSATWLRQGTGRIICFVRDITERKKAEQLLRESEQRFRAMADGLPLIVWVHDANGNQEFVNRTFLSFFGVTEEEMKGGQWKVLMHPDDGDAYAAEFAACIQDRRFFNAEVRVRRADGEWRWIESWGVPRFSVSGEFLGYIGTSADITERKQARKALANLNETLEQQVYERTQVAESRAERLRFLSAQLIEAEEKERKRIAELLHGDLQQILASAKMHIQVANSKLPPMPELVKADSLLKESINKTRRLAQDLSPAIVHNTNLSTALKWLARHMEEQFGIKVRLHADDGDPLDNISLKLFVFRAVQELLFNITKHAGVNSARVVLSHSRHKFIVTVSDQGRGFDPAIMNTSDAKGGLGLMSLQERTRAMGAHLSIDSVPGQGSCFTMTIPMQLVGAKDETPCEAKSQIPYNIPEKQNSFEYAKDTWVLIVDDHTVMRQGLIRSIQDQPGIQIVGEAADGREALRLVGALAPDVVLMDVAMPIMDGVESTRQIREKWPEIRVIGLSMNENRQVSKQMVQAGAEIVLSKSASLSEVLEAIYGR